MLFDTQCLALASAPLRIWLICVTISLHFYTRGLNFQLMILPDWKFHFGWSSWWFSLSRICVLDAKPTFQCDRSLGFFSLLFFFSLLVLFIFASNGKQKKYTSRIFWVSTSAAFIECTISALTMWLCIWPHLFDGSYSVRIYPGKSLSTAAMSIPMQEYIYVP